MKNNFYIKIFVLSTLALIFTYSIKLFFPDTFQDVFSNRSTLVTVFITLFILLNIVVNQIKYNKFADGIKFIGIWAGVFSILILLYAFRYDLKFVSHQFIAAIAPSYSWSNKEGKLFLTRHNDGHFYTDAYINGKKVKFLIDTGATDISLSMQDAKMLNIDVSKLDYITTYNTANGKVLAAPITLNNFKLGEWRFNNVKAHIGQGNLDISLLGMSLLKKFQSIEVQGDTLILTP